MIFNNEYIDKIYAINQQELAVKGKEKRFLMLTYGCQQNSADSEKIKGMLIAMGYTETEDKQLADIVLINTCCIRENAELTFFGVLGSFKNIKAQHPDRIVAICGCMMQQEHIVKQIKDKHRFVDIVFGTHNVHHLPELISKSLDQKGMLVEVLDVDGIIVEEMPVKREEKFRAWVTIMSGCNNYCTYCIVPYVRGRERSRQPEDILKEITLLAQDGCREVTLLGQNVNSYGKDLPNGMDFADLLKEVNKIEGLERIRFMTSHPKDISEKLIDTMAESERVCKQLHLPFQAGSNTVLKAMNRKYTKEDYLEKVAKVKKAMPNITLSTDVIVGFPGESDEDFMQTLEIMKAVRFDQAFMYLYSRRKGTPADLMENQIAEDHKHHNFNQLVEIHDRIAREINETYMDKVVSILVEGPTKNDRSKYAGRTEGGKTVNFSSQNPILPGEIVKVRITEIRSWSLNGELE